MEHRYTFEEIEEYLAGSLSPQAITEFEKQLEQDAELANEVTRHRETHKAVELFTRLRLKEKVGEIQNQESAETTSWTWSVNRIAAMVVLLAVALGSYFILYQNYSDQSLASSHFEPYPNRFTTMGESQSEAFSEAMELYDKGEYQQALKAFNQVPPTSENYVPAQLYLAIAYYSLDQYTSAISALENVQDPPGIYSEVINWYLALSYLKNQQPDKAAPLLRNIVENNSYQAQKAQNILSKLDSPLRKLPGL